MSLKGQGHEGKHEKLECKTGYVKNMRREYFKAFASKCKVYGGMEKRCQQMQKLCSEICCEFNSTCEI